MESNSDAPDMIGRTGRLPYEHDERTLSARPWLRPDAPLPDFPDDFAYGKGVGEWGMLGNDRAGCCTCTSLAHSLKAVTARVMGKPVLVTTKHVTDLYTAVTGYDPSRTRPDGSNPTDNGAVALRILKYVRHNGFAGRGLAGFGIVDPKDDWLCRQGAFMFGGLYTGHDLPRSIERQQKRWSVEDPTLAGDSRPGGLGGHMVYTRGGGPIRMPFVTWNDEHEMTPAWFRTYCEEAWVLLWEDWVDAATHVCPVGLNLDALLADLGRFAA